jgi:hypothetical protein
MLKWDNHLLYLIWLKSKDYHDSVTPTNPATKASNPLHFFQTSTQQYATSK